MRADSLLLRVGRRIAELRRSAGLTQAQFGEVLGVSTWQVQHVERGGANLTLRSLERYARGLGVEVGELFVAPAARSRRVGRPRSS